MANAARVLFASMIGTTIEFFDFYIYATAAVLVFPRLFFAAGDPTAAVLQSLATFALAFFARPVGSVLFGHFGDRIGRKRTLVAALMTMGLSTVLIGLLPTYASIGVFAPLLLCLCRFGQGLGLGGEWGGAVLLAVENAPQGHRARYGMFPQLGAPVGFLCSSGIFLLLSDRLSDAQFFSLWLANPVPGERRAGVRRAVRAAAPHRDAGVRARDREQRARARAHALALAASARHGAARRLCGGGHLRHLLSDDRVFAQLGDAAYGYHATGLPAAGDDRRVVLCADRSRYRPRSRIDTAATGR